MAAAAKCFMFRKREHLKLFMSIQTVLASPDKALVRRLNPKFKSKLSSHLCYFDASLS